MHPTRAYVIIFLGLALIIGGLCIVYPVLKRRAEQWRENAPKRDNIAEIKKKRGNITEEGRQKGMWKPQNGKWKWQETNGQGRKRTQLEQRALPLAAPFVLDTGPENCSDAASVLPDSVRRLLPPRVAQRLRRCAVDARCKFARLNAFRSQTRARFNLSQPKPVAWTCEDAQCSAGLGDQWRGIASAFYQGLAVGFELVTRWTWPVPVVPDMVSPVDVAGWRALEQAMGAAERSNSTRVKQIGFFDDHAGKLCLWTNVSAVAFRGALNYKPNGTADCDFNAPVSVKQHIRETSWAFQGIGCLFWHKFAVGKVLEGALTSALRARQAWQAARNRTAQRVVAVHVRGGDKHLAWRKGFDGRQNPFEDKLRARRSSIVAELLRCADTRARALGWEDVSYFVLADNAAAKAEAARLRQGRVFASPETPVHSGTYAVVQLPGNGSGSAGQEAGQGGRRGAGGREESKGGVEKYVGVWVDMMAAALCDMIVVSPSALAGSLPYPQILFVLPRGAVLSVRRSADAAR